tara:strand:- start:228 stop:581 length:354 start_codon:yes stop_codon:yes gene_type:complete
MSKFKITSHKGFNLTFNNGWQVSVQFGPGNYCERQEDNYDSPKNSEFWSSNNAEIAVWHSSNKLETGNMVKLEDDVVRGWTTADEVAKVIHLVSTAESDFTSEEMTRILNYVWKEVA